MKIRLIALFCTGVFCVACTDDSSSSATSAPATSTPATDAPDTTSAPDPTVGAETTVAPDTTQSMAGPYEEGRDARADIAAAQALAAQEGKLVLLDFGANWCTDCIVLDELYHDPEVAALLAERYVLVTIDVGEFDRNLDVSAEYNDAAGVGIPSLVVLTADGTIIADTHAGEFASARDFVPSDVLQYLGQFNP